MNKRYFLLIALTILVVSSSAYSQSLSYLNYIPSEIKGDTVTETVYGISLEGNLLNTPVLQNAKVYLPPNYDKLSRNYYPVLYLLPGYGSDQNGYYKASQLFERLNELITSLKIKPVIVVTPNSKNAYLGSYFSNSYVTGNWEDFIAYDLTHHIDSLYNVNSNKDARGLSGFSMGGYGTLKIGMKHPAVFGTIGSLSAGPADFNEFLSNYLRPYLISAAKIKEFSKASDWQTQLCFAMAAAFAPDSNEVLSLGRFPYTEDGESIDSIWQQWLDHDPLSMISVYQDSLLSLNSILMYIGRTDEYFYTGNKSCHQTLLENNITHTYREFDGGHELNPIFNDVLMYFSDNLDNSIPTITGSSEYYLERGDSIRVKSDVDGTVFIIPLDSANCFENIVNDHVVSTIAFADSLLQIPVQGLDYNKYQVFAMSQDSSMSNVPAEFCLVPDISPPVIELMSDTVPKGDSIRVSISRDGTICFLNTGLDAFETVTEIITSPGFKFSLEAQADEEISFSTDSLSKVTYSIYGYDQYGFVAGPVLVTVGEPTDIIEHPVSDFALFPNPAQEKITLKINNKDAYEIVISTLNGHKIYSRRLNSPSCEIDISSFQKGIYVITIRSKDFVTTRKIIKL